MAEPADYRIREKHPLWLRCWHWLQGPVLLMMLWSGLLIYWANDIYWPPIPQKVYETFGVEQRLAEGMGYHFAFAWPFTVFALLYTILLIVTGRWRDFALNRNSLKEACSVILHDLGCRRPLPSQGHYNSAQKIAYIAVLILTWLAVWTGLAIYKPVQFHALKNSLGGYEVARLLHYLVAVGFLLFSLIHIVQVIRAGWNTFRAMVTGFEAVDEEHPRN